MWAICAFRNCRYNFGSGISMFGFPKDPERAKLWLHACRRTDLLPKLSSLSRSKYRLCESHFEDIHISKSCLQKKRLFKNAVPSIFPGRVLYKTAKEKVSKESKVKSPERNQQIDILEDTTIVPIQDKKNGTSANSSCSKGRLFNNGVPSMFPTRIVQETPNEVSTKSKIKSPERNQKIHRLQGTKIVPIQDKKNGTSANSHCSKRPLFNKGVPSIFPRVVEETRKEEVSKKSKIIIPPERNQETHILQDNKIEPILDKKNRTSANKPNSLNIYIGKLRHVIIVVSPDD
ncbi:52 kDa repressor of the inhibitor of the protein kinase-like [Sitophilus oryzae]|uniref:52 kDa repressor of the inhibitor of the protein kinase-like n=1 Tax=Sitophilus oryzae TaxID=7048 RepID=A0A6J2Y1G4_SITOR|nr:52 kDa repressor of the inhibitor of the protein kinase-like [Sitophilus oryzae]